MDKKILPKFNRIVFSQHIKSYNYDIYKEFKG